MADGEVFVGIDVAKLRNAVAIGVPPENWSALKERVSAILRLEGAEMARKNYTAEQIIGMLREAEVRLSGGEKTGANRHGLPRPPDLCPKTSGTALHRSRCRARVSCSPVSKWVGRPEPREKSRSSLYL